MTRTVERLHDDFRFRKFDVFWDGCVWENEDLSSPALDDSGNEWESVSVPHDWAAGKDFAEENDLSENRVTADGIETVIRHSGRTGALPTVGTGVYRRRFFVSAENRGMRTELIFDGVMWQCEIYINGKPVHRNHFGYLSFSVDITDFVNYDAENLLTVKAEVFHDCSRWYSGAGIFRNVYLVTKSPDAIAYSGIRTQITDVTESQATLAVTLMTVGSPDSFELELCSPDGIAVCGGRGRITDGIGKYETKVELPVLWEPKKPALYTLTIRTFRGTERTDADSVRVGFRSLRFDPDHGFFLNGKNVKIHGVCNHHDLGVFGAAVNRSALARQITLLLSMGVNAIRTSHNPPAPELLDLCDEMGILVIDEFFDEWRIPKVENGYAKYFDMHADADARAIIHRDMNHPSVFLWSIGNEIEEQRQPDGWKTASMLAAICHEEDPTRPVTAGLNMSLLAEEHGFFDALDVIGLNYKPHQYPMFHEKYPDKIFYGSETASCVSLRGDYFLPADIDVPVKPRKDLSLSDYGLSAPNWATYPDRELLEQATDPFIFGEFVWTGFDYLGEPTPYYSEWPSRSSYFGIFDTAGLPKSRYFLYKSLWSEKKILSILPHWNFEGHEGENIPVHILTNYDRVELFLNGRSLGIREKSNELPDLRDKRVVYDFSDIKVCRIVFDKVPYEPGELCAVARDENDNELARTSVKTAGEPFAIRLAPERQTVRADGEDACFVRADIIDRDGNLCPTANIPLTFAASGVGWLYGTDNGDPRDTVGYASPVRRTLNGSAIAVLLSKIGQGGNITLRATAENLVPCEVTISSELSSESKPVVANLQ